MCTVHQRYDISNNGLTGCWEKISLIMCFDDRYKVLIHLWGRSWSTSIKRQLASGAAVMMPDPNPHESYITAKLARWAALISPLILHTVPFFFI